MVDIRKDHNRHNIQYKNKLKVFKMKQFIFPILLSFVSTKAFTVRNPFDVPKV